MNKNLHVVIDGVIHLLNLRFKQGMTDTTWDLPTLSLSLTHSRAIKSHQPHISILVHPHFHAYAFKRTSAGVVWVLSTQKQYLSLKMKGTRGLKQTLHHACRIHRVYPKPCNKSNQRSFWAAEVAANLPWNHWFRTVALCASPAGFS